MPYRGLDRRRRRLLILLAIALLVALQSWRACNAPKSLEALHEGNYQVQRVVDGDTLLLTNHARVRLIGIDAPETVKHNHPVEPWGREASAFTRDFVEGREIRLQFDRERIDQYDRFLAYVWVGDRMLNEELLRAGLARWEPGFRYSEGMKRRFRRAQHEAQQERRGLWSSAE